MGAHVCFSRSALLSCATDRRGERVLEEVDVGREEVLAAEQLNANARLDFFVVTNVHKARRMVTALVLVKARSQTAFHIYPEDMMLTRSPYTRYLESSPMQIIRSKGEVVGVKS